jgi:hypothetical protein
VCVCVCGDTHNVATFSNQFVECNVKLKLDETSDFISDIKSAKCLQWVSSNNNFIRPCSRSFTQLVRTVQTRGCRTDRALGQNGKFTRCLSSKESNYIYWNNPITSLGRPWGFQKVEVPRFQDNRHMKAARMSALRTGGLYFLVNIPGRALRYKPEDRGFDSRWCHWVFSLT